MKAGWNWNYIEFCDNMNFIILLYFYQFQSSLLLGLIIVIIILNPMH